jgi:hypothetical protein
MSQSCPTRGVRYCFACTYWGGQRAPTSAPSPVTGKVYALLIEGTEAKGSCMNASMRGSKRAYDSCSNFQKLQNLD